jgi:hypothetical protein
MKEYLGLKETGWDCVNQDCGKPQPGNSKDDKKEDPFNGYTFDDLYFNNTPFFRSQDQVTQDLVDSLNYSFAPLVGTKLGEHDDIFSEVMDKVMLQIREFQQISGLNEHSVNYDIKTNEKDPMCVDITVRLMPQTVYGINVLINSNDILTEDDK